jgi:hypothetical protein
VQFARYRGEMGVGRALKPLEPVLIEERGERRLAEFRLPDDPEQRGCGLIRLARKRGQDDGAQSCITVASVRAGPQPEIDEPPALQWGQHEMSGLVQDDIGIGRAVKRAAVPIERALDPVSMDCHAQAASQRKGCLPIPLGRFPECAIRRGRADPSKNGARERVLQLSREAAENLIQLLSGYGGQDHQRYMGYVACAGRSPANEIRMRTAGFRSGQKAGDR